MTGVGLSEAQELQRQFSGYTTCQLGHSKLIVCLTSNNFQNRIRAREKNTQMNTSLCEFFRKWVQIVCARRMSNIQLILNGLTESSLTWAGLGNIFLFLITRIFPAMSAWLSDMIKRKWAEVFLPTCWEKNSHERDWLLCESQGASLRGISREPASHRLRACKCESASQIAWCESVQANKINLQ